MECVKKGYIDNIFNFFCSPFQKELKFFIVIFIISSIVDIFVYCCTASVFKAAFIGLHHYIICYCLTLILDIIHKKGKKWYKILVLLLVSINFIIDFVCIYSFHSVFSEQFTSIFANTNFNEIIEFVQTYITYTHLIVFALSFFIITLFYYKILKPVKLSLNRSISLIGVIIALLGSAAIGVISTKNIENISVMKFYSMFKDVPPDLSSYMTELELDVVEREHIKNIVVIIGESFSKSHSSLYGYEKETNPLLVSLRDSNLLYVYNNVVCSSVNTVPAFKSIMSTYRSKYKDSIDWYRCTTIHEILHKVGYDTYWFSNQNKHGLWDNVVTQYAMLSNHVFFNGEKFAVKNKIDLDGDLINLIKEYGDLDNDSIYKTYFVHLMGSHYHFEKRYPADFERFKPTDYPFDDDKKDKLSKYDNSILYNDYVVYEIMRLFESKESIVIYFPDHGLDVYESSLNYIGHAMCTNAESVKAASSIPFMIYMSPMFQKKYPLLKKRVEDSVNNKFCTDDLIYTIMDILSVKFQDNDNVEKCSLLF